MWMDHPNCRKIISEVWGRVFVDCPMSIMSQKPKVLKQELGTWNKNSFGDVHANVKQVMEEVVRIQAAIENREISDELLFEQQNAQSTLQQALHFDESFWKEKARVKWHSFGDRNTAYFHRVAKIRQASKRMTLLKDGDLILDSDADIEQHALNFFTTLYASDNNCITNGLISEMIPSLVSVQDNVMLTNLPSIDEIKGAVFPMCGSSAPGPDGFGGFFYQRYWGIVGSDLCNLVIQIFTKSWIMPNMNSNLVVLLPKHSGVDRIQQFQPIALANFEFKVITKIMADRLASVAAKIISKQQRGFIKRMSIVDCICTASEVINMLDHKSYGGNVALKFDIKKAFDTMNWYFLLQVLSSFGFDDIF